MNDLPRGDHSRALQRIGLDHGMERALDRGPEGQGSNPRSALHPSLLLIALMCTVGTVHSCAQ